MRNKSIKTALMSVMVLLCITQLVFYNTGRKDRAAASDAVLDNSQNTSKPSDDNMYTEEVVSTEIKVVYRNTVSNKDIALELEERRTKTDYDNKIVSYTVEQLPIYEAADTDNFFTKAINLFKKIAGRFAGWIQKIYANISDFLSKYQRYVKK